MIKNLFIFVPNHRKNSFPFPVFYSDHFKVSSLWSSMRRRRRRKREVTQIYYGWKTRRLWKECFLCFFLFFCQLVTQNHKSHHQLQLTTVRRQIIDLFLSQNVHEKWWKIVQKKNWKINHIMISYDDDDDRYSFRSQLITLTN